MRRAYANPVKALTLIISAITPDHVLQVSDQRITEALSRGVVTDTANKATIVFCRDARFICAYTGLAGIGSSFDTSEWLVATLMEAGLGEHRFDEVAEHLRTRASGKFEVFKAPLAFDIVGYATVGTMPPFYCKVSNFERPPDLREGLVTENFETTMMVYSKVNRPELIISGAVGTLKPFENRINKIRRDGSLLGEPKEALARLVDLLRCATSDSESGDVIGRYCIGVAISREPTQRPMSYYFPDVGEARKYDASPDFLGALQTVPNLVSQKVIVTDAYMWTGAEKPPWFGTREKLPGWKRFWPNYKRNRQ